MRDQSRPGRASVGPCPRLITTRQGLDTRLQPEPSSTCTKVTLAPPTLPLGKTPGHEGVHLLTRLPGTGWQDTQPSSILQKSQKLSEWISERRRKDAVTQLVKSKLQEKENSQTLIRKRKKPQLLSREESQLKTSSQVN